MYEKVIIDLKSNNTITIDSQDIEARERVEFINKNYDEQILQLKEEIEYLKNKVRQLSNARVWFL